MKKLSVLLMATAALGLTACSAKKSTSKAKDTSSKNKSAFIVHKHKAKGLCQLIILVRKKMWL